MKKLILIILCVGVISLGLIFRIPKVEVSQRHEMSHDTHPNNFFDGQYFTPKSSGDKGNFEGKIGGAVVPHHLLAHQLIAEIFAKLQRDPPPLLIVLGPNHQNRGARILTSRLGWDTPFGTVSTNGEGIEGLLNTGLAKIDDSAFTSEHSIGNLMPFVKCYLPDAKVIPIILHHDVSQKEAAQIAEYLATMAKQGAVIVSSVDFSHYLTRREAEEKDKITLEAMKEKNFNTIFSMGNDHLDSPAALGTLFFAMEYCDIKDFELIDHTNSGILMGNDLIETTSYMTLIFKR